MGARWYWVAVCPRLHVYSNFSGGADDCYECGAEPEAEFDGDDASIQAAAYARLRQTRTPEQIRTAQELVALRQLAEKHGYRLVPAVKENQA